MAVQQHRPERRHRSQSHAENVQPANIGDYRVIVTNDYGSVTSSIATLAVSSTIITTPLQNQHVPLGSNATFTVTATGPGTLAYQWQFNSADLAGATNEVLLITNAQPANIGNYRVIVTNNYGSATSSVATLTLLLPPTVTTLVASNVGAFKATLKGTVNPNGTNATDWFEWGSTTAYGNVTPAQAVGGGSSPVAVSATISNLTHLAAYHYRLVATNVVFRTDGADASFTTLPALPVVSSFTPVVGPTGTVVTITGSNLSGATFVGFNGTSAAFTVMSDTQISAIVPAGATYGRIVVAGPGGVGASAGGFVVRPVDSSIAGPFFPPPLGCSFLESSSPDEGAIGRTGGKTWYFYNVALADLAVVYWGAINLGVRLSFVQSPFPTPYLPAKILSYASNLSDLPGGVVVWTGLTRLPPNMTTVYTRCTLRIKDVYNNPLSLMNAASLGFSNNVGAVLVVTPGLMFQANMLFEASFSSSGPFQPALEFYDAQSTPSGGGTAYTSFGAGFFYENTRPVFTSGPFADVSVPRNTAVGPIDFTFTDAETGASSVSFLPPVSSNQALLPYYRISITRTAADAAYLRAYPLGNQSGKTLVTVFLTDGRATNSQSFLLTVNNPPSLTRNDPLYTTQGASQVISNTLLAAADTESPAAQLTYTVAPDGMGAPPHNGWLQLNGTNLLAGDRFTQEDVDLNRLSYLHDGGCSTNDDFTFNVSDPDGGVTPTGQYTTYTFRINIAHANHAPLALNGSANVGLAATFTGAFSAIDTDCPPVVLTFRVLTNGTKGTLVLTDTNTGAFSYTAFPGQTGNDTVVFQVNDGALDSEVPGVFTFTIANQAPTALPGSGTTMENKSFNGTLAATDPDQPPQTLNYRIVTNCLKGIISIINPTNGAFIYQPDPGAIGTDVFSFVANDGTLDSAPGTFTMTIRPNLDPGDIVIADGNGRRVVLIDPAGAQFVLSESNLLVNPRGIALEPSGAIVLVDQANGVLRVNPTNGAQTVVSSGGNLAAPVGIAVDNNGMLLVSDAATFGGGPYDSVLRIDPASGAQTVLATNNLLNLPTGLATASGGRVLTANNGSGAVVQIDGSTGAQTVLASSGLLFNPFGIAVVHRLELRLPSVLPDRRFRCLVYGEPGEIYLLQSSPDLETWNTAGYVTNVTDLVEFIDPTAPGQPVRFYRVRPQ
ncbi:MAG: cadherin-like domain-containing protein [Verrucomicrobiia bacterium]